MSWTHYLHSMAKRSSTEEVILIEDHKIPLKTFFESRRNVRIASGKESVLMRIPAFCNAKERDKYRSWAIDWIQKQWDTNPRFRTTYQLFELHEGYCVHTYDNQFELKWSFTERKHSRARLIRNVIDMQLAHDWDPMARHEAAVKLIYKALSNHYQPIFAERVLALHANRFAQDVSSVSLKNMVSKWGSCSHHGKMSFSTRLIFAPESVQDYVLVHELCHLEVMNHSGEFWNLVEKYDPDYKAKEHWLKTQGHLCDLTHAYRMPGVTGDNKI